MTKKTINIQTHQYFSGIIFLTALIQSLLAVFGIWNISDNSTSRISYGLLELVTMAAVIANIFMINRRIKSLQSVIISNTTKTLLIATCFCFIGDVINRNFSQQFYQYDALIKHSYLIDSILFFLPGYSLMIVLIYCLARHRNVPFTFILTSSAVAVLLALISYNSMHLEGTSPLVTIASAAYSIVVSILAVSALWLLASFGWLTANNLFKLAAIGLVLAMIADALIGQFWIFGAQGQGFYPSISHLNWIIYIASHLLIQQMPFALIAAQQSNTLNSNQ